MTLWSISTRWRRGIEEHLDGCPLEQIESLVGGSIRVAQHGHVHNCIRSGARTGLGPGTQPTATTTAPFWGNAMPRRDGMKGLANLPRRDVDPECP